MANVLPNALWWSHFYLLGGWRKVPLRALVYAVIGTGVLLINRRLNLDAPLSSFARIALAVVGAAQLLLSLLICSTRIAKAIKADETNNMVESHRLSPMSGFGAVLGYAVGPNLQVHAFMLVNFIAGLILASIAQAGLPGGVLRSLPVAWIAGHLYLAFLCSFIWTASVLAGMCVGRGANLVTMIMLGTWFGGWRLLTIIPGLGLLVGAQMIAYVAEMVATGTAGSLDTSAALSPLMQLLAMLVCARAAARKFERPDLPAFSTAWALLFYALWLCSAATGLYVSSRLQLPFLDWEVGFDLQLMSTLLVSMLLAALPIRSAASTSLRWLMQHRHMAGRRPLPPALVAAIVAFGAVGALAVVLAQRDADGLLRFLPKIVADELYFRLGWTLAVFLVSSLTFAAVYRLGAARRWKNLDPPVILLLILLWGGPPLVEGAYLSYAASMSSVDVSPGWVTAISPAASIVFTWIGTMGPLAPGLAVQTVLCVVLHLAARWAVRRRLAQRLQDAAPDAFAPAPA